ncbi:MAG: S-layer homology domain-containing protein [Bacillota bacterium]|jgi:hypothetical protein
MTKKIAACLLTIGIIFCFVVPVMAENDVPASVEAPQNFTVREGDQEINFRWKTPQSILNLIENSDGGDAIIFALDWKQDNGNWHFENKVPGSPCYTDDYFDPFDVFFGYQGNRLIDDNNTSEGFLVGWHLYPELETNAVFDFKNSTYYFRMSYLFQYYDENGEEKYIRSPYTNVVALGKNASNAEVTKLDPPQNLKVAVKKDSSGKPYFALDWTNPASAAEANKQAAVYHLIDFKVGEGPWYSETHGVSELPVAPSKLFTSSDEFDPVEENFLDEVVIEGNTYYFRVLLETEPSPDKIIRSSYSNIASTAIENYREASSWAKPELDKAAEYGLITDTIKDKMNAPITREEFAELSVRLYEKTTGITAQPVTENPFTDTKNPEVLKANQLGIINGIGNNKFDPKSLTNREQVAAMLSRAIRVMVPDGDFSIAGAPVFNDEKHISPWAMEHVKFMSKIGVIKGADGKFMPKATITAEAASGYDTTTREQAVLMAVRVYEKYQR